MNIAPNIAALCLWFWPRVRRQTAREIVLPPRQIWSAKLRAGTRIRCGRGVVWLTQSGETTDTLLRAGQSFVVPRCSHVVAQSLGESGASLSIEANSTQSR